jgi:dienelactone hydrolase
MLQLVWFLWAFIAMLPSQAPAQEAVEQPRIVAPAAALIDEEIQFRVVGLNPKAAYELQAEFASRAGTVWRSNAQFTADEQGVINPATTAPVSGSYQGIDAIGMLWSMVNTKERQSDTSLFENDDQSVVVFSLRQGEKTVTEHRLTLRKRAIGISSTEIRDPFVGTLYAPYGGQKLPGVLVLGGSEGGFPRDRAALIASHGYVTLALAYFGVDPLPRELERIPLEYVDGAITWLQKQPSVDPERLAIVGGSKGAELALLTSARNPAIGAVIAIAPSSVVFQSITGNRSNTSSWAAEGKDVPFAPYAMSEKFLQSRKLVDLYESSLAAAPPAAEIPVEKIRGPILLLAGKDDALWPSAAMAERIAERARRTNFRYPVKVFSFPDAGHHAASLPLRPTADSVRLGGTAQGLAAAQVAAWDRIGEFLQASLASRESK